MTRHQKIGLNIFIIVGLLLLISALAMLRSMGINASELDERGEVKWQISMSEDFDDDGKKENLLVTSYDDHGEKSAYILAKEGLFQQREKKLIGFEEDIAFCPLKTLKIGGEAAICIFGEVGVHAQNVQIVYWKDFEPVEFISRIGEKNLNMISDVPNFDFNYAKEGKFKIYFDARDYDNDPLVDIIRTYYYLSNNAFRYDSVERISTEGLIK